MNQRLPAIRIGDIVTVNEGHYRPGLGRLTLHVIEVGRRERHGNGIWLRLRGIELHRPDGTQSRQRRVLVYLPGVAVHPGRPRRRINQRTLTPKHPAVAPSAAVPHLPVRPSWTCSGCQEDWPCADRRQRLRAEYQQDPAQIRAYLMLYRFDAATDLHHLSRDQLRTRFLSWIEP